jgi:hypothetical protein
MKQVLTESLETPGKRIQFPIPTGGWNARDQISGMKRDEALYMDNLYPLSTEVVLRKGYKVFVTCPEDEIAAKEEIRSFLPYFPPNGNNKLFAANGVGIFDVTNTQELESEDAVAVSTDGDWRSVNMTTPGGSFLWACNGKDKCLLFNGTAWVSLDTSSTPALTGITSESVVGCTIFKNRIFLVEKNSLSFYYLPLNSIAGAATAFPLGAVFSRGGYLIAQIPWTIDAGEGSDDYLITITSQGEVAIYKGTDPSSASTFALVGVFQLAKPLSRNCFCKVGGDVYIITEAGLFPLSKSLISSSFNRSVAASDRISDAWKFYTDYYKDLFGWNVILFPKMEMLFVNVPIKYDVDGGLTYSYQFVMNTRTGAWCRFTGLNASTWCEFDGNLFFAFGRYVNKAWEGYTDDQTAIDVEVKTAYNRLFKDTNTQISLLKIITRGGSQLVVGVGIDVDYEDRSTVSLTSQADMDVALWDSAVWDESKWAGDFLTNSWRSVNHYPGYTLSLRLKFSAKNINMKWIATDLIIVPVRGLL